MPLAYIIAAALGLTGGVSTAWALTRKQGQKPIASTTVSGRGGGGGRGGFHGGGGRGHRGGFRGNAGPSALWGLVSPGITLFIDDEDDDEKFGGETMPIDLTPNTEFLFEMKFTRPIDKITLEKVLTEMGLGSVIFEVDSAGQIGMRVGAFPRPGRPGATPPAPAPRARGSALRGLRTGMRAPAPSPTSRLRRAFQAPVVNAVASTIPGSAPAGRRLPNLGPTPGGRGRIIADLVRRGLLSSLSPDDAAHLTNAPQPADDAGPDASTSSAAPSGGGGGSPSGGGGGGSPADGGADDGSSQPQDQGPSDSDMADLQAAQGPQDDGGYQIDPTQDVSVDDVAPSDDQSATDQGDDQGDQDGDQSDQGDDAASEGETYRVRFVAVTSRPVRLVNTAYGSWSLVWPVQASVLTPVQIVPRRVTLEQGQTYEIRFLSEKSSPNIVRALLEKIGFDLHLGPFMMRRHIRHPGLPGELSDWVVRATWKRPDTTFKDGGIGPLLFEHVVRAA